METSSKVCRTCGVEKPLSNYGPRKASCHPCVAAYEREYRKQNLEKCQASERRRYQERRTNTPFKVIMKDAKNRAKGKGLSFDLTDDYLSSLYREQGERCAISGMEFDNAPQTEHSRNPFAMSLDRIDSSEGYVEGNVRIVLWAINGAIAEWGGLLYLQLAKASLKHNGLLPA